MYDKKTIQNSLQNSLRASFAGFQKHPDFWIIKSPLKARLEQQHTQNQTKKYNLSWSFLSGPYTGLLQSLPHPAQCSHLQRASPAPPPCHAEGLQGRVCVHHCILQTALPKNPTAFTTSAPPPSACRKDNPKGVCYPTPVNITKTP